MLIESILSKITLKNIVKYIIQGIAIAIIAYSIPNRRINYNEILIISTISTLTFLLLDIVSDEKINMLLIGAQFGTGFEIARRVLLIT
jgi:hypothetical protein